MSVLKQYHFPCFHNIFAYFVGTNNCSSIDLDTLLVLWVFFKWPVILFLNLPYKCNFIILPLFYLLFKLEVWLSKRFWQNFSTILIFKKLISNHRRNFWPVTFDKNENYTLHDTLGAILDSFCHVGGGEVPTVFTLLWLVCEVNWAANVKATGESREHELVRLIQTFCQWIIGRACSATDMTHLNMYDQTKLEKFLVPSWRPFTVIFTEIVMFSLLRISTSMRLKRFVASKSLSSQLCLLYSWKFASWLKACSHRAFAFAIFCIIQCRKRFHLSLVSMGDANANARCKQAIKTCLHQAFAFFCIIQCRKRFHPSFVSTGDANANAWCKQAFKKNDDAVM